MDHQEMALQIMAQSIANLQQQQDAMLHLVIGLQRQIKTANTSETTENNANASVVDGVPNQMRTTLTSAKRVIELYPSYAEKTAQNRDKFQTPRAEYHIAQEIAQYMYELKNRYVMLEQSLALLRLQSEQYLKKIPELEVHVKIIGEKIKNIAELQDYIAKLSSERQNLPPWARKRKKEIDKELELFEAKLNVALHSFNSKYHIPLDDVPYEIERIREEIDLKRSELDKRHVRETEIKKELDAIEIAYRNQKQIADNHPDRVLIYNLLEQMREAPATARKSLQQMQIERRLDGKDGKIR